MSNILTKLLRVPWSNATRQITVAQLWEVRWTSRHGEFSADISPQVEAFPSLEEAETFAQSLKNAFALLKHRGAHTGVSVRKAR